MYAELALDRGFHDFVERAEAAGKGEDDVRIGAHQRLALAQIGCGHKTAGTAGHPGREQIRRDHAERGASVRVQRVGEGAHQSGIAAAIDQPQPPSGQTLPETPGLLEIDGVAAGPGPAEHGDSRRVVAGEVLCFHGHRQSGSGERIGHGTAQSTGRRGGIHPHHFRDTVLPSGEALVLIYDRALGKVAG